MDLRIGVLAPSSNFVPFLASDLLAALEFGLCEAGLAAELVVETAGYNAERSVLVPKAQQLLLARAVCCVVAPLNVALFEPLAGHFEGQRVPLVALTLGEDPLFESAEHPYVFVDSFHLWHAAWMCGHAGAQRFGPRAASMVALHDGGYGMAFAFPLGLEARNGSLLQTVVTHRSSRTEDPSPLIAEIASKQPDFVWGLYSGKEAVSFLKAYAASEPCRRIPLMGLPFLVDPHVRELAGDAAVGVHSVSPRRPGGDRERFADAFSKKTGRSPHAYALLAYESAHLIAAAVREVGDHGRLHADLPEALRGVAFDGPRGPVRFGNGVGTEIPLSLRQVTRTEDIEEALQAPPQLDEQYALARRKLAKQGWLNPYLCA